MKRGKSFVPRIVFAWFVIGLFVPERFVTCSEWLSLSDDKRIVFSLLASGFHLQTRRSIHRAKYKLLQFWTDAAVSIPVIAELSTVIVPRLCKAETKTYVCGL